PAGERTRALAAFTALLAVAALLTPIWAAEPARMAGLLLLGGAAAEITQGFRRRTAVAQRSAWVGGACTLLLALLLLNAAGLVVSGLAIFVAVPFAVDGLRQLGVALRQAARHQSFLHAAWAAVWDLAVMLGVLMLRRVAVDWVVALAAGLRLVGTAT